MEDEERQKKLEAGKAKLAEYRQRKAYADSQKKQKKKKKKKPGEGDSEGDSLGPADDQTMDQDQSSLLGHDGEERRPPPTTEFSLNKTLRSGETVRHDQTYTIEPESEVSTTAEDYSSEEEVDPMERVTKGGSLQDMEEDDLRAAFGSDGVQQLQDFEAALKQRDGIITQLTANLQQAREEKDEIMKEFLQLTEQSQKLQIQFQQLQAGESLRNSSHSSTAADLLQTRQTLQQLQQQLQESEAQVQRQQDHSRGTGQQLSGLQQRLSLAEQEKRRAEESLNEKDLLISEQEKTILNQEQSLKELRMSEESFAQTLKEKTQLLLEQSAIISEHEQSLSVLREELSQAERARGENHAQQADEKDRIIAEKDRVIIERDYAITQLEDELESSQKRLHDISQRMETKEVELERCLETLESAKSDLESCENELNNCKLELEKERSEFEGCKNELTASKQKERMSSNEIMQLMGTVEDLQKRCHQGSLSESETILKMQEDAKRELEVLRAELDEMYGQQIVQMKTEINLQNSAKIEQINQQHHAEIELLKSQYASETLSVSTSEMDALNVKIRLLQETLDQSQIMHDKTVQELNQVNKDKQNLQEKVDMLARDLMSSKERVELASHSAVTSQESHQSQLQHLQGTIDDLKTQLQAAQESALEAQEKYESEITNYKIKLEMLEREKDAVLDRMAESQEAELERLRTQLLFSHEEELTNLREELQRESFMNTENLLNEAAIKHEKALENLRISYDEKVKLLQEEKSSFAMERDKLLHQILGLKDDLNAAVHGSNADELVRQLQELQAEIEELRREGEERVKIDNEIRTLREKTASLETQAKQNEQLRNKQQSEIEMLNASNKALKEEIGLKIEECEASVAEGKLCRQQVLELTGEIEKQRATFSFAEKNFEVNYQELKGEYTCLAEAKAKLEEKKVQETLELESKISSLETQIQKMEDGVCGMRMDENKTVVEKDTTEFMEKLNVTLSEKDRLTERLREVTEQLAKSGSKVKQLEEELIKVKQESAQNELGEAHGNASAIREASGQQQPQLREEIQTLQSLLKAAEQEKDQAQELHRASHTPSPAPVEPSLPSSRKSSASGSNRRKRRQRAKQKQVQSRGEAEEVEAEEEEEGVVAAAAAAAGKAATETATSAAEPSAQTAVVMSCTHKRIAKGDDDSDESRSDAQRNSKQESRDGMRLGADEVAQSANHGECRLRMEAKHLSLSQIHTAQLELLQEETEARTKSLEMRLQNQQDAHNKAAQRSSKYTNVVEAVTEECREIILSFQKLFGENFLEKTTAAETRPPSSTQRPESSESLSVIQAARELCRELQQVRDGIEKEHDRLSLLQTLLRADGSKMLELQNAYESLKSSSEKDTSVVSQDRGEQAQQAQATAPSASPTSAEIKTLKVEAQQKQQQLEERHRQEVERLRAHFQQQAAETEERYATELFMLQQRLQEVNAEPSHFR